MRKWTIEELELLAHAWGPRQLWTLPLGVFEDPGEARVEFDDEAPKETLRIYLPPGSPDHTKVHEAGHALHLLAYPESAKWSTEKCEVFAMLGVVRLKLEDRYLWTPIMARARALFKQEPLRYDRLMKLAADDPHFD